MLDWVREELDIIKEKLWKDFKVVTDCFFENYMSLRIQQNSTTCPLLETRKMIHLTLTIILCK